MPLSVEKRLIRSLVSSLFPCLYRPLPWMIRKGKHRYAHTRTKKSEAMVTFGHHSQHFQTEAKCLLLSNANVCASRSSHKRLYPDRDQTSSPTNKQARKEDAQRGR